MIAYVDGFLEPVDFRGHLVTVVGPIVGVEAGKIGMTPYNFVVIKATGYKRWHIAQQVIIPPTFGPWGYRPADMWGQDGRVGTIQAQQRYKLLSLTS